MSNYHFYLLDEGDEILNIIDLELAGDDAASAHARALLARCHAVEFMRGSVVLGKIAADTNSPTT
ncbi:MAG: hypothetical protein Q8R82_20460 [Hyphomonadaceae bacterium]|nr:hypothetical protein [Hyphomonadaceae bacterium]